MHWWDMTGPEWRKGVGTLWVLGRVGHLPTVWSNCLAGWLLSGGGHFGKWCALCAGASCLYLGGVFLHDACDAGYDRTHRRDRPIAAGRIDLGTVLLMSVGWFLSGLLFLVAMGKAAAVFTVILLGAIVLFNLLHRVMPLAPCLLAAPRCLLYWIAGAAGADGLSGLTLWSGLAMGCYVSGVGYLSRPDPALTGPRHWYGLLLAVPLLLAWLANGAGHRWPVLPLALALVGWALWSLRYTYWVESANLNHTAAGLWAGLVLVDLLAVAGGSYFALVFILCFAATLVLERLVPDA